MHEALPAILIFAGLVGFYLAARSAHEIVGRRAPVLAYALPLAATVLLAAAWGKPDVALGTALSAALASLALVGGLCLIQRKPPGPAPTAAGSWALLVPGALALVIVGLSGNVGPGRAGALLLLALFVLPVLHLPPASPPTDPADPADNPPDTTRAVRNHPAVGPHDATGSVSAESAALLPETAHAASTERAIGERDTGRAFSADPTALLPDTEPAASTERTVGPRDAGRAHSAEPVTASSDLQDRPGDRSLIPPAKTGLGRGLTQLALAAAVAGLGGWALIEGTDQLAERKAQATAGLLAAAVLGPATVMPLLGLATSRAADGHTYHALGLCVRFSATAALLLAPLAALVYLASTALASTALTPGGTGGWPSGMPFPATLFRVEAVLLAVVGALLLPLASAHLTPRRRDGLLLVGLYTLYLLLSAWSNALAR